MSKTAIEYEIVKQVIAMRKTRKKTQRDIAELLNVSAGYVGQVEMESSSSMYSYNQLNEIAKYLDCSMKDFMPEKYIENKS